MLHFQLNQSLSGLASSAWLEQMCPVMAQGENMNLPDMLQSIISWARRQYDSRLSVECLTHINHTPHRQLLAVATALSPATMQQRQQQENDMESSLQDNDQQLLIIKKIMQPLAHLSASAGRLCLQMQGWSNKPTSSSPDGGHTSTTDSKVAHPSSATVAMVVEHFKQQLFWSCQLAVAVQRLLIPLASAQASHHLTSKWQYNVLPVILEQLNACFQAVARTGAEHTPSSHQLTSSC